MNLTTEFAPIRQWAEERGIYAKGDPKTQFLKLQEEAGELAQGLLKNSKEEVADAIGDMVVVLVNLAQLAGHNFEICVNGAFDQIKNRKGEMRNGTFIKES